VNLPCLDRKIKGLPSCVNSSLSRLQDQGSVDFEKRLSRLWGWSTLDYRSGILSEKCNECKPRRGSGVGDDSERV